MLVNKTKQIFYSGDMILSKNKNLNIVDDLSFFLGDSILTCSSYNCFGSAIKRFKVNFVNFFELLCLSRILNQDWLAKLHAPLATAVFEPIVVLQVVEVRSTLCNEAV